MFINSISSLLSGSVRAFPFLRRLYVLIQVFIFTGSNFVLSSFFISSAVLSSFGFTVSLCRSVFPPDNTSEKSFFLPPLDGAVTAVPWLVSSVKLAKDGATCPAVVVDFHFSRVSFSCLTSFRVLMFSSAIAYKSYLRINTIFLKLLTGSWIECYNSIKFPLFPLD